MTKNDLLRQIAYLCTVFEQAHALTNPTLVMARVGFHCDSDTNTNPTHFFTGEFMARTRNSKFTRRHYTSLAKVIRQHTNPNTKDMKTLIEALCVEFERDNSAFRPEQFKEACNAR